MKAKTKEFLEELDNNGVAVSSVSDGFVFAFSRIKLKAILESLEPDQDSVVIFVKTEAIDQGPTIN